MEKPRIAISISKNIYEKDAILAAIYALSGRYSGSIEPVLDGFVDVILEPLVGNKYEDFDYLERIKQCFQNELIDQQLRLDLEKKHGSLRDLIVRQAFSPLENLENEVEKLIGRA